MMPMISLRCRSFLISPCVILRRQPCRVRDRRGHLGPQPTTDPRRIARIPASARPDSVGQPWLRAGPLRGRSVRRLGVLASGSGTILQAHARRRPPDRRRRSSTGRAPPSSAPSGRASPAELVERTSFGADFDRVAYTHRRGRRAEAPRRRPRRDGRVRHDPRASRSTTRSPVAIVNTHPALLPAFKGWHAVRDALAAGVKVTGCTVHLATLEVDDGPDPRPGGGAGPRRRHRGDAARAHQGGRAPPLPEVLRELARRESERRADARARCSRSTTRPGSSSFARGPARPRLSSWCRRAAPPRALAEAGVPVTPRRRRHRRRPRCSTTGW